MINLIKYKFNKAWSIGIYVGQSPFNIKEYQSNPIFSAKAIKDIPVHFVADPFIIPYKDRYYILFEMLNASRGRGEIGVASSKDFKQWNYEGVALSDDFHLSYPLVFEWSGDYYMVPESSQANAVRLYRALNFPLEWEFVLNLMEGKPFLDSTIFNYNGMWWMYTTFDEENLKLFYSNHLISNRWTEHPKSPVINGRYARPGGRVLLYNNTIYRFSQDPLPDYGHQIIPFEVKMLSTTCYNEVRYGVNPFLNPSGKGWNENKMHHIDFCKVKSREWIIVSDGYSEAIDIRIRLLLHRVKIKILSKLKK